MTHANLKPDAAQALYDNLPTADQVATEERARFLEGKARLAEAVFSNARAYYRHLLHQDVGVKAAKRHVRHRFGVEL